MRKSAKKTYLAAVAVGLSAVIAGFALLVNRPAAPNYDVPKSASSYLASTPAARPAVLFVGDSYTAGHLRVKGTQTFARIAADRLGWICNFDAQGGTGYLADGRENSEDFAPYIKRLARTRSEYLADYIIVSGGRNDPDVPGFDNSFSNAASTYIISLHEAFPEAKMIVLAPFWQNDNPPESILKERAILQAIARRVSATYIDTSDWINPSMISGDGIHPTLEGHQKLADHLVSALEAAGLSPFDGRADLAGPG